MVSTPSWRTLSVAVERGRRRRCARRRASSTSEAEGFDEIVIGAGVEADDDVDLGAACGEDDEQDLWVVATHSAGKLDAIEVGKAEVEQNDSGLGFGDMDEGGTAGAHQVVG